MVIDLLLWVQTRQIRWRKFTLRGKEVNICITYYKYFLLTCKFVSFRTKAAARVLNRLQGAVCWSVCVKLTLAFIFYVSTCWCLLKSWNSHIDQQHLRNDYVPVHEICRYENLHFALLHNVNSTRLPSFRSFGRHSIYQCAITQWLITSLLSASAPRSSLSPKNSIITSSSFHPGAVCCQTAGKLEWLQLPPPAPSRSAGNINQLFIHKDYCSCYLWNQIWAGRLHGCLLPPRFVLSSSCPCQNKIRPLS